MIVGLQIILTFFTLFMIYVLFIHWKKKEISLVTLGIWGMIWLVFLVMVIFPGFFETSIISRYFVRLMDFGTVMSLIVLCFLTVENNVKIKKLEDEIEKLVRDKAIKNVNRRK